MNSGPSAGLNNAWNGEIKEREGNGGRPDEGLSSREFGIYPSDHRGSLKVSNQASHREPSTFLEEECAVRLRDGKQNSETGCPVGSYSSSEG